MKKIFVATAVALISTASFADFGSLVSGATSAVSGGSGSTSSVSVKQITDSYIAGSSKIATAQENLLKAVDLNAQADEAAAKLKSLKAGATSSTVDDASTVFTKNNELLKNKFSEQGLVLDAKGKTQFALGMKDFAAGVVSYVKLGLSVKGYRPSASDISSAGTAMAIAKSMPSDVANLKDTFGALYSYAKSNNIALPKEATDATKALSDWK